MQTEPPSSRKNRRPPADRLFQDRRESKPSKTPSNSQQFRFASQPILTILFCPTRPFCTKPQKCEWCRPFFKVAALGRTLEKGLVFLGEQQWWDQERSAQQRQPGAPPHTSRIHHLALWCLLLMVSVLFLDTLGQPYKFELWAKSQARSNFQPTRTLYNKIDTNFSVSESGKVVQKTIRPSLVRSDGDS